MTTGNEVSWKIQIKFPETKNQKSEKYVFLGFGKPETGAEKARMSEIGNLN